MSAELKPDLQLEIAHLLLIDVVGYSKLLVNEQIELVQELNRIVRSTNSFQNAQKENKLIRVPTGDGMALIFFRSPEEPARCALEITNALKLHPEIMVRMGAHSGPVNQVTDVNDQVNVAGSGINVAQRLMDCGDAGHILMSKHMAEDLGQYGHWRPFLHDLGEYEVKHGLRLHIVNLCKDGAGNPVIPQKLKRHKGWRKVAATVKPIKAPAWPRALLTAAIALSVLALLVSLSILIRRGVPTVATKPALPVLAKSIAVLPFENLGTDQESTTFADGVHDEILTDLAKIADLKVISRTSVMQYKHGLQRNLREIAKALGVANVVEGSVQRTGNRVRVSAQLIDADTDTHRWAESYERDLKDVFGIQSEIAKKIADQLQAKISPTEKAAIETPPTADLAAFDLYERAKTLWVEISDPVLAAKNLPQAARLLDEALTRDPNFLLAWCLLSRVHGALYWNGFDHSAARLQLADVAVQRAVGLRPDAGEVHLALATYYYFGFRDYERARTELAAAKRTLPNNAEVLLYSGFIDRRDGRWAEATTNMEHALDRDPRNLFTLSQLAAYTYRPQRRYAEAIQLFDRALSIAPRNALITISRATLALHWRADIKPFQTTFAEMTRTNPTVAPDIDYPDYALCERTEAAAARLLSDYPADGVLTDYGVNCPHSYWEGVIAKSQRDPAKAAAAFATARKQVQKILEAQPDFAAAISLLGMIDAGLGRKEDALREGRKACELMPTSKDAITGNALAINLAQIYAWTGEKALAIDQIAAVEQVPTTLSYGLLKLHPYWDSLRGDPKFEKLLASLAPND